MTFETKIIGDVLSTLKESINAASICVKSINETLIFAGFDQICKN